MAELVFGIVFDLFLLQHDLHISVIANSARMKYCPKSSHFFMDETIRLAIQSFYQQQRAYFPLISHYDLQKPGT